MIHFIRARPVLRSIELVPIDDIILNYAVAAADQAKLDHRVIDFHLDAAASEHVAGIIEGDICVFPIRQYDDQIHFAAHTARDLRARLGGGVTIVYCGHTQVAEDFLLLRGAADYVVRGEERELVDLLGRIVSGRPTEDCAGIARWNAVQGVVVRMPPLRPLLPLDELPAPNRYALETGLLPLDHPYATIEVQSSRGCYARCTYCYIDAMRESFATNYYWRQRSPQSLIAELDGLAARYPIRLFSFYDANFFAPGTRGQEQAREFARRLLAQRLDIRFTIYARATDVEEETFALLRDAGLLRTYIGIESFSPSMLKRLKKGASVEDNLRAIQICQRLGVFIAMGFITFDHDTTIDELRESLAGLKLARQQFPELLPDPSYLFGLLEPLPNTAIFDEYAQRKILSGDSSRAWSEMFVGNLASYTFRDPRVGEVCAALRRIGSYMADQLGMLRVDMQRSRDPDGLGKFTFLGRNLQLNDIALAAFDRALMMVEETSSIAALRDACDELYTTVVAETAAVAPLARPS